MCYYNYEEKLSHDSRGNRPCFISALYVLGFDQDVVEVRQSNHQVITTSHSASYAVTPVLLLSENSEQHTHLCYLDYVR